MTAPRARAPSAPRSSFKLANAPCSWGVLELDAVSHATPALQVLDEMAASGFQGTELGDWGFLPRDPHSLAAALESRSLTLVAAFVPVAFSVPAALDRGVTRALRTASLLAAVQPDALLVLSDDNCTVAHRTLNAGRISSGMGLSSAQWRVFAAGVTHLAQRVLDQTGISSVFHHHCGGFVETPEELDTLMELCDPRLVGLCLDTGHLTLGGGDPLQTLDKWGYRLGLVHLKDCDLAVADRSRTLGKDYLESLAAGVFCELGRGDVDFAGLLRRLHQLHYEGWLVVEQDVLPGMGSPLESARRNRLFLANLGLRDSPG